MQGFFLLEGLLENRAMKLKSTGFFCKYDNEQMDLYRVKAPLVNNPYPLYLQRFLLAHLISIVMMLRFIIQCNNKAAYTSIEKVCCYFKLHNPLCFYCAKHYNSNLWNRDIYYQLLH